MRTNKFLEVVLVAAATLTPMVAFAQPAPVASPTASDTPCSLKTHRVVSVTPYRVEEHVGHATYSRLRGANLQVQAEPGLTKEWLQLTLSRHLTEMRGTTMKDCPFELEDVTVSVHSAGSGFNVRIVARDAGKAQEVLRRAQHLLG